MFISSTTIFLVACVNPICTMFTLGLERQRHFPVKLAIRNCNWISASVNMSPIICAVHPYVTNTEPTQPTVTPAQCICLINIACVFGNASHLCLKNRHKSLSKSGLESHSKPNNFFEWRTPTCHTTNPRHIFTLHPLAAGGDGEMLPITRLKNTRAQGLWGGLGPWPNTQTDHLQHVCFFTTYIRSGW